jgi:hypothetical protein
MIAARIISRARIKQSSKAALIEWFKQAERLGVVRDQHYR